MPIIKLPGGWVSLDISLLSRAGAAGEFLRAPALRVSGLSQLRAAEVQGRPHSQGVADLRCLGL